jgi:hypothetical protein
VLGRRTSISAIKPILLQTDRLVDLPWRLVALTVSQPRKEETAAVFHEDGKIVADDGIVRVRRNDRSKRLARVYARENGPACLRDSVPDLRPATLKTPRLCPGSTVARGTRAG